LPAGGAGAVKDVHQSALAKEALKPGRSAAARLSRSDAKRGAVEAIDRYEANVAIRAAQGNLTAGGRKIAALHGKPGCQFMDAFEDWQDTKPDIARCIDQAERLAVEKKETAADLGIKIRGGYFSASLEVPELDHSVA
jgi:hypothetical protein